MKNDPQLRILLILTGGTIGTVTSADGIRRIPGTGDMAEPLLLSLLRDRHPELLPEAAIRIPYQVLSEHMTPGHLEQLADCLRRELTPEAMKGYDAVCITHGSDTLAYTAAFLGELMQGCPVPVFLLAAQRPPEDPESNALENVTAALQLAAAFRHGEYAAGPVSGSGSSVWVPYRNSDGVLYLHRAEELIQCEPGSDDFFSCGMKAFPPEEGEGIFPGGAKEWSVPEISLRSDVLVLHPYVGIDYDHISLDSVGAVLHTLYHSSTAPKELAGFLDRCREAGICCYILPCDPGSCHYETTGELLQHGAVPVHGMTEERAYMRLLMGRSVG